MSADRQGRTSIVDDLLASLPAGDIPVRDVRVGPFWTVVWTERGAGLASTQRDAHTPHGHSLIRWAGESDGPWCP